MVDKHSANPRSSLRPIARFTPPIIEKLQSKGVAMYAYGVSAYYA